jgi:hypothetical protein
MRRIQLHRLAFATFAVVALAAASCGGGIPGGGDVPGGPNVPGSKASSVDPNTCGNYAATDAGRKLKAFLEATVTLDRTLQDTGNYLRDTCAIMGKELGMAPDALSGDTKPVCDNVIAQLKSHLQVGLQANANLNIDYQPAVCTVNVDAAASAAAECSGSASADVAVSCEGTCEGTCNGTCDGTCEGSGTAGTGGSGGSGECNGKCDGTCQGSCTGGCSGHADVQAEASCKAKAEVHANVEADCTEPEVTVTYDASIAADTAKLEAAVRAIEKGMPRMLFIGAKITGPIKAATVTWLNSANELQKSGRSLVGSLDDQAMCVFGQLSAAFGMIASIQVQIDVQVEVSASASGAVSGGA